MTTPYYTPDGNPPAQTRGVSAQLRTEFTSIQTGFNSAQADIALKAPLASPTFTGTVTLPATVNATDAVRKDYADALAFSSALPAQTGNAGKLPNTDGMTATWSQYLNAGVLRWKDGVDATKLLAFDLSGITTGNTRSITMPDKSGTLAMTSDTALRLLATLTPTAAANVDALSVFSATYDNYLILADGIKPGTDDTLVFRFANGGVVDSGSNYCSNNGTVSGSTTLTTSFGPSYATTAAGKGATFSMRVTNANLASTLRGAATSFMTQVAATPGFSLTDNFVAYIGSAISGIRLYWNGGANFAASGSIRIYGYTNS